ncbi:unnamed protein product [Lota lota]
MLSSSGTFATVVMENVPSFSSGMQPEESKKVAVVMAAVFKRVFIRPVHSVFFVTEDLQMSKAPSQPGHSEKMK